MSAPIRLIHLLVLLTITIGFGFPRSTEAHRLDEYLQATRISLELERVGVELNLTPGAAVADHIFAGIDQDRNGTISADEAAAYARLVITSLTLSVDGRACELKVDGYTFPQLADMRSGEGIIRLRASAKFPQSSIGPHRLVFANTHRPDIGVYLINALMPTDGRIRITNQARDTLQKEFKMEYRISEP
jgi:hypothetical protein